jgi:hypothetical protein
MNRNKTSTRSTANSLQINRFVHVSIPIFLSGYGGKTHRSREFHDTTALYSQQTTLSLSGGCVYEFLEGSNSYGLVDFRGPNGETRDSATQLLIDMLLKDGDTESVAYLTELSQNYDPNRVAEKRDKEDGFFLIFHDFVNYRSKLSAVEDLHTELQGEPVVGEQDSLAGRATVDSRNNWPWESEVVEPDTCVDWDNIDTR